MALIEEFEKQGNFLFRWRSYVPSFILLLSFFYIPEHKYFNNSYQNQIYYAIFCFLISLLGLFIRCFTIGYAPEKTSGRNTKKQVAETVNQTGIYSLVRHPLYIGNFFMFFGIVLLVKNLSFTLIFFFFYWMYYERIMFTEEMFLRNKFGAKYLTWAEKTPALLPRFSNYKRPELDFSYRNILKREYPSLFGILIMFLLYDIILIFINEPNLADSGIQNLLKPHHEYIFIGSVLFYIIVRILVKFTRILHVEGR
ncbi:MAG: lipid A Kdo2 1-phosphate O-methyltransferase [Leptospiraceae bacterium]|nr:lipid A Kdo2 1-phosphate O-methyltransferase [Leptospiraceae bacterium]MCP5511688.1 lipid A Kdo2 1-phosphate O-methyltransferase [Leptospiraceae bacterium]